MSGQGERRTTDIRPKGKDRGPKGEREKRQKKQHVKKNNGQTYVRGQMRNEDKKRRGMIGRRGGKTGEKIRKKDARMETLDGHRKKRNHGPRNTE